MKLTPKAVKQIKIAPGERQQDIKDEGTRGLYLRLFASGKRSFIYRYKMADRVRVLTLGDAEKMALVDARAKAHEHAAKVRAGNDPGAEAQQARATRRRMPTVAEFVEEYIERHAKPKKITWSADAAMLESWVVPRIGRIKLDAVHRRDIVALIDDVRDAGNVRQPGKVLAVVRRMFNFAIERGVLDVTPVQHIAERQPRPAQKAMTAADVRLWWTATGQALEARTLARSTALALRLLLLTGQRPGEVAGIRVSDLDLEDPQAPVWRIPAERRKHGKEHAVALAPMALDVVQQALECSDGVHLFTAAHGGACRADGLPRAMKTLYAGRAGHPTPHAARHTVATELENLGCEEGEIARVLGHQSKTVTGLVYINRRSLAAQRVTLEAWERRLLEIVEGRKAGNVVTLRGNAT